MEIMQTLESVTDKIIAMAKAEQAKLPVDDPQRIEYDEIIKEGNRIKEEIHGS